MNPENGMYQGLTFGGPAGSGANGARTETVALSCAAHEMAGGTGR